MDALFTREGVERKPNGKTDKGAPVYRSDKKCFRCGGAGGSDKWAATGWKCYRCNGRGIDPNLLVEKLYTAEKLAKLVAAQEVRDAKKREIARVKAEEEAARVERERNEVRAAYAPLVARIEAAFPGSYNEYNDPINPLDGEGFIPSLYRQITQQYRWLSDRQLEAVEAALTKIETEKARKTAAEYIGEVGGKIEVEVQLHRVVSLGDQYRPYYICVLRTRDGSSIVYKGASVHSLGVKWNEEKGWHFKGGADAISLRAKVKEHNFNERMNERETIISHPKVLEAA